jgi:ubiquinone biosynthesis protein Coq4
MELTTAQAIATLTLALNTEEVETILSNGEELHVTAFAELFTATEDSVYHIIGLEQTEEEAAFIVNDELLTSPTSGEIIRDQVITYPIRASFQEALDDYSLIISEKVETHTSYVESLSTN